MNKPILTLDIDWAPDFVIDFAAEYLLEHHVRATWFVTHPSPAIERLRQYPNLFELGIHPNFKPDSTQGKTWEEVLRYCMSLVPEAVSMRTHSLVQSSPLLAYIMAETPLLSDVSLFLPYAKCLHPIEYRWYGNDLLRIPYFWEDDFEMERRSPSWSLSTSWASDRGLNIYDFHPIHIYLNSPDMLPYYALKASVPNLTEASPRETDRHVHTGLGTQGLFKQLVEFLVNSEQSFCIRDVYQAWRTPTENGEIIR